MPVFALLTHLELAREDLRPYMGYFSPFSLSLLNRFSSSTELCLPVWHNPHIPVPPYAKRDVVGSVTPRAALLPKEENGASCLFLRLRTPRT